MACGKFAEGNKDRLLRDFLHRLQVTLQLIHDKEEVRLGQGHQDVTRSSLQFIRCTLQKDMKENNQHGKG